MTADSIFKRLIAERLPAIEIWGEVDASIRSITLSLRGGLEIDGDPYVDYTIDINRSGIASVDWWDENSNSDEKWKKIRRGLKTEDEIVEYVLRLMEKRA